MIELRPRRDQNGRVDELFFYSFAKAFESAFKTSNFDVLRSKKAPIDRSSDESFSHRLSLKCVKSALMIEWRKVIS